MPAMPQLLFSHPCSPRPLPIGLLCSLLPQSLTFSASDDAYLFSPLAPPAAAPSCCTALEHVNGTVLFRQVGGGAL